MKLTATRILIGTVLLWPALLRAADRPRDGTLTYPLATVLGVKAGDVVISETIARVVGSASPMNRVFTEAELAQISDVLTDPRGVNFDDVIEYSVSDFWLEAPLKEGAKLGTPFGRARLYEQLVKYARRIKATDRNRGIRCARGAVVLAAADCEAPQIRWMYSKAPNEQLDKMLILDPEIVAALGLTPEEHESMVDVLVEWSKLTIFGTMSKTPPSKTLDEMIKHYNETKAIDQALLDEYLARSASLWENAQKTLIGSKFLSRSVWRCACLLRGANDAAGLEKLDAMVAECEKTALPIAKTWLNQAMTRPGAIPRSSGVRIISEPGDLKPKPNN